MLHVGNPADASHRSGVESAGGSVLSDGLGVDNSLVATHRADVVAAANFLTVGLLTNPLGSIIGLMFRRRLYVRA